ncbi:MAG: hypothetical protein ABR606_09875 [Vicinamibacterales bacterium]
MCPALLFVVSLLEYVPVETRLAGAVAQLEAFLPQEMPQFLREQSTRRWPTGKAGC